MKKFFLSMALGASLLLAGGDMAPVEPTVSIPEVSGKTGLYVGGFTQTTDKFKDFGGGAVVGYDLVNLYGIDFATEARYSKGKYDDVSTTQTAVFLKPSIDVGFLTAYGLAGYGKTEIKFVGPCDRTIRANDKGFMYGGGVSTVVFGDYELFADYTESSKVLGERAKTVQLGVNYKF